MFEVEILDEYGERFTRSQRTTYARDAREKTESLLIIGNVVLGRNYCCPRIAPSFW
jgi:hypothetical protein